MRIALIDSSPSAQLYPVGLLKLGAMLRHQGHECKLFTTELPEPGEYQEIWIGTIFTFDLKISLSLAIEAKRRAERVIVGGVCASLMPERFIEHGIEVYQGLHEEGEKYSPDYTLLQTTPNYSITHISRGCVRKCGFCMVPKIEGKFRSRDNWEKDINAKTKEIRFYDNNFLALPLKQIESNIDKLKSIMETTANKTVDFNQGLDCRLLTKEKANAISRVKIYPVRFAFDGMQEDGHIQKAISLMAEHGARTIINYVLYNFEDTTQDFYYRLRENARMSDELGISVSSFPMRYQPIMNADEGRRYVGKHWTEKKKKSFMNLLNKQSISGQISVGIKEFEYWFTDSAENFDKLLSWDRVSEYASRKKGKLRHDRAKNASES